MGPGDRLRDFAQRGWAGFRDLPRWGHVLIGVVAIGALGAALDDSEDGATEVSTRSPTGPPPTTATTVPPTTTTTLAPGLPPEGEDTTVTSVTDGDTLIVADGTRIRLIGIDTPETTACFAAEATARLTTLLPPGTKVRLTYDAGRLDAFERTLAYVYRFSDGLFVNLALAREGYARQLTVRANVAHAAALESAVTEAEQANRGLWASCPTTTTTQATAAAPVTTRAPAQPRTLAPTTTAAPANGCHESYTGACVPIATDVDCGGGSGNGPAYVYAKNFSVVGFDEYDLDADNDGIACES